MVSDMEGIAKQIAIECKDDNSFIVISLAVSSIFFYSSFSRNSSLKELPPFLCGHILMTLAAITSLFQEFSIVCGLLAVELLKIKLERKRWQKF